MSLTNNRSIIKNLHLIISASVIIPIALVYGLNPGVLLWKLFYIRVDTVDLTSIFRAMMGLYLGTSAIWIVGVCKPQFWRIATWSNIVFMGSLAFGRFLSLITDGFPSIYFITGLLLELILALWGIRNLRRY